MTFTAKCPKCRRDVGVAFAWDSGQKIINCPCGSVALASGMSFDPQPEFLFKYRPHDCHSESWILKEEMFFSSPAMFNDPFDSKVMYTLEGTVEEKKKYFSYLYDTNAPGIKKKKKWEIIKRALKDQALENDYEGHIARVQRRVDEYGIVSFSRKSDDLLMFAYYARDHTGYCLKYRRSVENVLSLARVVNYEENYPKFSIYDEELRKPGAIGDKVLYTKALCWKHEDEWRLGLAGITERVLKSPHPILEGIIFGCCMKPNHRSEIIELNKRRTRPVLMFEARKKKFEFALEIVPLSK
jgi:hypothetical protein